MATSLRELIVSVSADTTKYQREMDRASRMGATYFRSVQQGGAAASRSWDMQTAAARTHASALEASTQALTRYAAVAVGAFSAGQLVSMADDWGQISARIRLATESQEEFELAQGRLLEIANRTYRDYKEAADQFAGTAQAMREMGFAARDTLDAAEALGLALVAGGSDAQRGASANDAWAKSMVQGKIATEQFQTLLLQTPRVIQALGDGLGKTTAELQQMAKDGQLTAQVVVPAITSQMARLRDEVESMPTTVEDAGIRFRNELRAWIGGANDTYGATQVLVGGLEFLADHLEELVVLGGSAAFGALAGQMIQLGRGAVAAATGMVQSRMAAIAEAVAVRDATLAGQLKAQADLRRAQAAMAAARGTAASGAASRNLATALLTERQATLAAAQAQAAYQRATSATAMAGRAALGVLGGPAGLAITVGMVAAGWLVFRDNTGEAEQALIDWSGAADVAVAKFRELNREQQRGEILRLESIIGTGLGDARRQIDEMAAAVANLGVGGRVFDEYSRAAEQLLADFEASRISADEFSAGISALNEQTNKSIGGTGDLGRMFDRLEATVATTAVEVDKNRGSLETLNAVNSEAERQANATAGALTGQAGAMDVLGAAAEAAGKKIDAALKSLPGQIERIGKSASDVARLDVRDFFRGKAAEGVDFSNREDPAVQALLKQGETYIRLVTEQDTKQRQLAESTKALAAARREAAKVSDADEHLKQLNESYADQIQSLERQIALHGQVGRSGAMAYDLVHGALSGLQQAQKDYLQEAADWLDWLDEMAALDQVWKDTAEEHRKYADDAKKTLRGLEAYADQAARNMQSALGDTLYNILDGKFDGIAQSFSDMLKRMAAELLASELWKALGSSMSGYSGDSWWGSLIRGIGGAITRSSDGTRAVGGRVDPWSTYDITEHGDPEIVRIGSRQLLVTGSKGGMVSPLMQREAAASAALARPEPVKIEIINNSGGEVTRETSRTPGGEWLERIIIGTVNRRGSQGDLDGLFSQYGARRQGHR